MSLPEDVRQHLMANGVSSRIVSPAQLVLILRRRQAVQRASSLVAASENLHRRSRYLQWRTARTVMASCIAREAWEQDSIFRR